MDIKLQTLKQKMCSHWKKKEAKLPQYFPNLVSPNIEQTDKKNFIKEIETFLTSEQKILLLQGDTCSGKTLSCLYLANKLLTGKNPTNYFPIYVDLLRVEKPFQKCLTYSFSNFTFQEIEILQKEKKILFILDHYDGLLSCSNLHSSNKVNHWIQAKILIICRAHFSTKKEDYICNFVSIFLSHINQMKLTKELYLCPVQLSKQQVNQYIEIMKKRVNEQKLEIKKTEQEIINMHKKIYDFFTNFAKNNVLKKI